MNALLSITVARKICHILQLTETKTTSFYQKTKSVVREEKVTEILQGWKYYLQEQSICVLDKQETFNFLQNGCIDHFLVSFNIDVTLNFDQILTLKYSGYEHQYHPRNFSSKFYGTVDMTSYQSRTEKKKDRLLLV